MTEFRAKLRLPKPELVLGAKVSELEQKVNKRGIGYIVVRFSNYPLVATFNEFQGMRLRQALRVHGCTDILIQVGDELNLNVRWEHHEDCVLPVVRIDDRSLIEEHLSGFVNRNRAA